MLKKSFLVLTAAAFLAQAGYLDPGKEGAEKKMQTEQKESKKLRKKRSAWWRAGGFVAESIAFGAVDTQTHRSAPADKPAARNVKP